MSVATDLTSTSTLPRRRPLSLRVGLFLCLFLPVIATLPAVLDFGLNRTGWDVVVIITAALTSGMTIATVALIPFAWSGRPAPTYVVVVIQLASVLLALPAFVVAFADGLPVLVPVIAAVGILLNLLAAFLVIRGQQSLR